MPTSPRAILLHTDQIFYTFLHTTVAIFEGPRGKVNREVLKLYETLQHKEFLRFFATWRKNTTIHA